jgi:hypothetical protein
MIHPPLFRLALHALIWCSCLSCTHPAPPRTTYGETSRPDVTILGRDPDGCTWMESRAGVPFGDHDTKHQARAQAVSEARMNAMQRLLGVSLRHNFMDFQQESSLKGEVTLTEHLLRVTQLGRVLKEEILWAGPVDVKGCGACRFEAQIRACIVPLRDLSDPDFSVQLLLNRPRFQNGDEAVMTVTSTRDAYLYVFNVDMDWNATLIFPNAHAGDNRIGAGRTFVYPDDTLRAKGLRSVARLPAGATISAETIRVIAAKAPLPGAVLAAPSGPTSFLGLMQRLTSTDLEWVEDAQAFTIQEH